MLELDDQRWKNLTHRMGDAYPFITDALRELSTDPQNIELFNEIIPYLCSEGSTYDSTFAAMPYIVDFAKRALLPERSVYLIWIGLIVIDSPTVTEIDDFLRDDYQKALDNALPLLLDALASKHDAENTRYLLASLGALKGYKKLGDIISNLDSYSFCLNCDEEIFNYEEVMHQA